MKRKPVLVLLGVLLGSALSSCRSTCREDGATSAVPPESAGRAVPASSPRRAGDGPRPDFDIGNGVNSFLSLAASTTPEVPPMLVAFNYSGKVSDPNDAYWPYVLQIQNSDANNTITFGGQDLEGSAQGYLLITFDGSGNPSAVLRTDISDTDDNPQVTATKTANADVFCVYACEMSTGGMKIYVKGPAGGAVIEVTSADPATPSS